MASNDCHEFHDILPAQAEVHAWSVRNFGECPQVTITLGLAEEVGELCRAVLKRHQNIRGTAEEWSEEIRKELGDCVIKLLDIAAYEDVNLTEVARKRWADVSQRDWTTDKQGHGIPEYDQATAQRADAWEREQRGGLP